LLRELWRWTKVDF